MRKQLQDDDPGLAPPPPSDSRALLVAIDEDWGATDLALTLSCADGKPVGLAYLGGYSAGSELDGLGRDAVALVDMMLALGIAPTRIAHSMSTRQLFDGTALPGSMLAAIVTAIQDETARP
ncbi:MAG: hypothetical protein DI556_13130 [Rhodovulum sulfidophilum]|uniref:Uncharacterized protein n=1 Tax=Rhodovulum sulfidophilum TaxID=35806 RepID=A0A2W5NDE7_RHOSU|nr:MAG: hypothetical protein DI556_13130 [Rhodovulum sulfidophilum]